MAFAIEFEQKCETLNSVSWVIFKPTLKKTGSPYNTPYDYMKAGSTCVCVVSVLHSSHMDKAREVEI